MNLRRWWYRTILGRCDVHYTHLTPVLCSDGRLERVCDTCRLDHWTTREEP